MSPKHGHDRPESQTPQPKEHAITDGWFRFAERRLRAVTRGNVAIMFALVLPVLVFLIGGLIDFQMMMKYKTTAQTNLENALLSSMRQTAFDELQDELGATLYAQNQRYSITEFRGHKVNGAQQVFVQVHVDYTPLFPNPLRLWEGGIKIRAAAEYAPYFSTTINR